jgi:integrase/recombinase XerD
VSVAYALDPLKDSRHREAAAARDLADWLKWLELGNKASRTLDTYERVCAALLRAFPNTAFAEFTDGDIAHILTQYPAPSRQINKAAINGWFKWGVLTRRLNHNPVDLLPPMRYRPPRSYDLFTEEEADALCGLASPDGQLLTLMFWAGLRRSECRMMTAKRIDFDRGEILVMDGAKGKKSRRVPMVSRLASAMDELLSLEGIGRDDFLWYSHPGGTRKARRTVAISNSSFDNWWQRCLRNADIRHRNPHMTRHTFATRLRELGLQIDEIQPLLGHESVRTTSDIYVTSNMSVIAAHLREVAG